MAEAAVAKNQGMTFGKNERKLLVDPLSTNNPITVQVLGICKIGRAHV